MSALNEHGVPLHTCNDYRHDEHYWAWVRAVRVPLLPEGVR